MSPPRYEISLLILLGAALLIGLISHIAYLKMIERRVRKTAEISFSFKDFREAMHISQGSNFNVIMLFSWSLFFSAVTFLYFLTPEIFPQGNYFRFPNLSSWDGGLLILGGVMALIGMIFALPATNEYSYYLIYRTLKEKMFFIPVFLLSSILCSVRLGTIYPATDRTVWNAGYGLILLALILLVAPMITGFLEESRR